MPYPCTITGVDARSGLFNIIICTFVVTPTGYCVLRDRRTSWSCMFLDMWRDMQWRIHRCACCLTRGQMCSDACKVIRVAWHVVRCAVTPFWVMHVPLKCERTSVMPTRSTCVTRHVEGRLHGYTCYSTCGQMCSDACKVKRVIWHVATSLQPIDRRPWCLHCYACYLTRGRMWSDGYMVLCVAWKTNSRHQVDWRVCYLTWDICAVTPTELCVLLDNVKLTSG